MMSALPLDVLPIILSHLTIHEILRVRLVCKDYFHITKSLALWHTYVLHHFVQPNIPIPGLAGRPLEALNAEELEVLAVKAQKYRRNWTSAEPTPTNRITFTAVPESSINALNFFSRGGESWLLSLAGIGTGDLYAEIFQCWDLKQDPPVCIARIQDDSTIAPNVLPTGRAVVAIRNPETCLIEIDSGVGENWNVGGDGDVSQACSNVAILGDRTFGIPKLFGDLVLTHNYLTRRVYLSHVNQPQARVELVDYEGYSHIILDVLEGHGWIIVARTTSLEIYPLPTLIKDGEQIEPIAEYTWRYEVDAVSVSLPIGNSRELLNPVHLVLRYGPINPELSYWAIDQVLRRFILNPNDLFDPTLPASSSNVPYNFPPIVYQVIESPAQYGTLRDMAIGSYGTIIYVDTEGHFGPEEFGQRLAGTRIVGHSGSVTGGEVDSAVQKTSVFMTSEQNEWMKIALQEQEGKIAIGHQGGQITILDYA